MRVIIAGSRDITDYNLLLKAITESRFNITTVISGTARGADLLGERWALENNIPCERYPADWKSYGNRAGYIRNAQMAEIADALIALWDGHSRGTANMISLARNRQLLVYIQRPELPSIDELLEEFGSGV